MSVSLHFQASGEKTGEKTLSLDRSGISEGRQGGFTSVDSALQNKVYLFNLFIRIVTFSFRAGLF